MEQPRDARFNETARPIPREAPVTTATLPTRSRSRTRNDCMIDVVSVF